MYDTKSQIGSVYTRQFTLELIQSRTSFYDMYLAYHDVLVQYFLIDLI